jgi:sugar-phosphatase
VERTAAGLRERHGVSFEAVVTRDDVSRPKPDPEPFLRGAELLGAEPGSCAVLEDAPLGIVAAKAAGMVAVAVPNEQTRALEFSGADSVQPDLVAAVRWLLATGQ